MKYLNGLLKLISILLAGVSVASACDKYADYTIDELKEFRAMLGKEDADSLDRLFAFEQMVCSDSPNIRSYAVKQGLNTIQDSLVRNEVMLRAMMQKTRIDVELGESRDNSDQDKAFIAANGGMYSKLVAFRSEKTGCLSLWHNKRCDPNLSVFISGDKVELNYKNVIGVFRLSTNGELVGTMRAGNTDQFTQIPAVIKLF